MLHLYDSRVTAGRFFRRALTVLIALLVTVFVAASIYISVVIFQRQQSLGQVSRYNISWSAGQAVAELTRLQTAIARAAIPSFGDGTDPVLLRHSIFLNRLHLLEDGDFGAFVNADPERVRQIQEIRRGVAQVSPLLPNTDQPAVAEQALSILSPLNPSLIGLAADANRTSGEAVSRDQAELVELHWHFTTLVAGLILCAIGLIVVVFWNHRLLRRAHEELYASAAKLHQTTISRATLDKALTNMSQGVCMFDAAGQLIFANSRFSEILGLPTNAAVAGVTARDLVLVAREQLGSGSLSERLLIMQDELICAGTHANISEQSDEGTVLAIRHDPLPEGGWLVTYEDVTERKHIEAKIAHMARHDDLTGLANRVLFRERLQASLARLSSGIDVAVLCLDLDHFKAVNDALGHPIGDELLRAVSARIQSCIRDTDTLARLGGDEFAIVQVASNQPDVAASTAKRLVAALEEPFELLGHKMAIGVSIGISTAPTDGVNADMLLKQADLALYRAKGEGRSTFRVFVPEMDADLQARRALEVDLRRAVAEREFTVFYQPLIITGDHRISGFEALLRWKHPIRGILPPSEFIALAEEIGLIGTLGEVALYQACREAVRWPEDLSVAVNVSPLQFRSGDIVAVTQDALKLSGLPPHRLQLEITETVLLSETDSVIATLHRLRNLGVSISMDDFGTGYSSLSYLRKFPFDKIKIDRSFVRGLGENAESDAIVAAVMGLGESLGIKTTVEGVETQDQLDWLERKGRVEVQGYLFGKPLPLDQTEVVIENASKTRLKLAAD